ncbi:MAG: hypothetical protein R6U21_04530 [Thermoplasmatota archaeon]
MLLFAVLLAVILGVVQFFSEQIINTCGNYYTHVISFSAGISITYVFVDLFPHFSRSVVQFDQILFVTVLFGFIFVHLVEKYVYQHSSDTLLDERLQNLNQFISFFYHMVLGIVIFDFTEQGLIEALLIFIPILIFTAVSTLPVRRHPSSLVHLFVSSSTVIGVVLAGIFIDYLQGFVQIGLVGFVIGGLLFSVIRHSIPQGKKGKPLMFILGVIIYTPIVLWTFTL